MKPLLPILMCSCAGMLFAQPAADPRPEREEQRTQRSLSALGMAGVEIRDVPLAEAIKRVRTKLAAEGEKAGGITIISNDALINMKRIDRVRTETSAFDVILELAVKSGAMVEIEGKTLTFKSGDCHVMPSPRLLEGEDLEVRRTAEARFMPRVDIEDVTVEETVDFIRMGSPDICHANSPKRLGFLLTDPQINLTRVDACAFNISIWNLLHLLAEKANASVVISDGVIEFRSKDKAKVPEVLVPPLGKAMDEARKLTCRVWYERTTLQEFVRHLNEEIPREPGEPQVFTVSIAADLDPEMRISPLKLGTGIRMSIAIRYVAMLTETKVRSGDRDIMFGK